MPAMYNDLSQDSQPTESMDTQSSEVPLPAVVSHSSILKEEDALLEPPSPMHISFLAENPSLEEEEETPMGNF